ncbi:MAG: GrpB family protein, partial [Mycobacteriales bacterium]
MDVPAVVVTWDPNWLHHFDVIAARIAGALPKDAAIEHVGSTSVEGLASKPIIDVDVVVPTAQAVGPVVEALTRIGYTHRGNLGIQGREAFSVLPGLPYHHLYVVVAGSQPHRDHVDLRDYLRARPDEAERYAEVKRRLAYLLLIDREEYV